MAGLELAPIALVAVTGRLGETVVPLVEQAGFSTVVVGTGKAAFEEVGRRSPRLIVLDLAVAGSLGTRLISAIGAAAPDTARFVLVPFETMVEPALRAGADGAFLPHDLRTLRAALTVLGIQSAGSAAVATLKMNP